MADTLIRNRTATHDSSHTSSSTSSRYNLREDNESPILVYEWRGGLSTSSESALCHQIDTGMSYCVRAPHTSANNFTEEKYSRCRVTKKPIPRFQAIVEVKRHDLYLDHEKELYHDIPNYDNSLASIKIPSSLYWSRAFTGSYEELYILSPETSPDSRRVSPSSSFSSQDAESGAEKN